MNTFAAVPCSAIEEKVYSTAFIDVHEHLIEERRRLAGPIDDDPLFPCDDWAYLYHHYAQDDLAVAGMPQTAIDRFFSQWLSPEEKWCLLAPYWPRISHTGYGKAVLLCVQQLFGENDIGAHNVTNISAKMRSAAQKGFYRQVLQEKGGIESCHVNSSEYIFCDTEYPDLLYQDLSTVHLGSGMAADYLQKQTGLAIESLQDYKRVVDWYFDRYGHQAVAVKNQRAYFRRLDYKEVPEEDAALLFTRYLHSQQSLTGREMKAVQDHLWRYCVHKATEYDLPVKLHTGYYGGINNMPLSRVGKNLKDLCPIVQSFPRTRFVLMHIAYPYQDELIALAKHYDNVYADLSCAWIISPMATVRFLREFLTAAPWNKLLTFGGDYHCVENVVGHAEIARRGLVQALSGLVHGRWLGEQDAVSLVEPLMNGNAREIFRMDEKAGVARAILRQRDVQDSPQVQSPPDLGKSI